VFSSQKIDSNSIDKSMYIENSRVGKRDLLSSINNSTAVKISSVGLSSHMSFSSKNIKHSGHSHRILSICSFPRSILSSTAKRRCFFSAHILSKSCKNKSPAVSFMI